MKKPTKRRVKYLGEAGKPSDAIVFRGKRYPWKANYLRKANAVRQAKKLIKQGYQVRLVKALGMWRIYARSNR